jgi:hypothetical protein
VAQADKSMAVANNAADARLLRVDMRDSRGFDGRPDKAALSVPSAMGSVRYCFASP